MDISVIVPTAGRKAKLKNCLSSLFAQNYSKDKFEIIVVDDRADFQVKRMIDNLKKQHAWLKYVGQSPKGPAAARNLGIKHFQGDIIAFVDDDCIVEKEWISLMVEAHRKNHEVSVIGGYTVVPNQKTSAIVSQSLSNSSIETDIQGKKEVIFFPTCNVSFKRQIFDKYSFNEEFLFPGGEDLEFFWRLFKDGYNFIWDKNIKVIHYRDAAFLDFIKQAYIYGRGNLLVQHIHRDHPLLKELKTGVFSFWAATLVNIIKIFRFSYSLGRKLINENKIRNVRKRICVYLYFITHKIFYLSGNIAEYFHTGRKNFIGNFPDVPKLLILDIIHSCNLNCRICDIWKTGSAEQPIDIFYIKKVLFQAKKLGIGEIALSGGEPLLRKDIFEILEYARSLGIKNLGVLTNGILVKEYMDKLKPYFTDNTICPVISFDSLKPELHNYIRNSDRAWGETKECLLMLSALKEQCFKVNFSVISIILNQNLEEMLELANFVRCLGANSLQFQTLLPSNMRMVERTKSDFWIDKKRLPVLDRVVDELIEVKKKDNFFIKNSISNLALMKKYYRGSIASVDVQCVSAYKTILMSNQGKCTTCFSAYGDVKKQNLEDIFGSQRIADAREETKKCFWPCLLPCFCDL